VTGQEPSRLPKGVIFDIGRVIISLNLRRAFEPLALSQTPAGARSQSGFDPEKLWAAILADPRWRDWQEGRMTPREYHEHITRLLALSITFDEFCAAWNRALDPGTILDENLFADLGRRCRLGLLSNTDPLHVAYIEDHFAFVRHFPARIYSCAIGASKPSTAIYQAALDALGISASEALYIDDIPEYAEAARRLGLDAIRFQDSAHLTAELSRRGLIGA